MRDVGNARECWIDVVSRSVSSSASRLLSLLASSLFLIKTVLSIKIRVETLRAMIVGNIWTPLECQFMFLFVAMDDDDKLMTEPRRNGWASDGPV